MLVKDVGSGGFVVGLMLKHLKRPSTNRTSLRSSLGRTGSRKCFPSNQSVPFVHAATFILISAVFRKAEMEIKRKQEEEARKKIEEEEKRIQVRDRDLEFLL